MGNGGTECSRCCSRPAPPTSTEHLSSQIRWVARSKTRDDDDHDDDDDDSDDADGDDDGCWLTVLCDASRAMRSDADTSASEASGLDGLALCLLRMGLLRGASAGLCSASPAGTRLQPRKPSHLQRLCQGQVAVAII